jgi:putative tryptophan/tyrosine transport system substrate-binding protein
MTLPRKRIIRRWHPKNKSAGLIVLPLLWLFCAQGVADAAAALFRVGVMIPSARRSEMQEIKGLREELKVLGYQEGKNIALEIDDAKGDRSALKTMLGKLIGERVDLIVTTGTRMTLAAKSLTQQIPIVFTHPADPVSAGLVDDLNNPGGNLTGVAGLALQSTDKRLALLKEMIPTLDRIYIFYDAENSSSRENYARGKSAATQLGIQTTGYGVKAADELKSTFAKLQNKEGEALFQVPDDLVEGEAEFILDMARQKKLPTMFNDDYWASQGALASYGPSYHQMGRQAAQLVDKILRGQKPGNLAIARVSKFDFVINYRAVRAMGLVIAPAVLKKADRIIR